MLPGNTDYRLALGLALAKMGQMDDGAVYLKELLKRQPDNGSANLGLARIAASRHDTPDAITYYHRAIDGSWPKGQEQNRIEARFELADYLAKQGQKTQAIAELLAALGQVQERRTEKTDRAAAARVWIAAAVRRCFPRLLRADGQDAEAYRGLGAAQLAQDNYLAARNAFNAALRINPSDEISRAQLELCNSVLALDPDARGIRSAERYKRSQTLLAGALALVDQCAAVSQANPQLAENAKKAQPQHPRASGLGDATEENLTLAAKLWRARQSACPTQAPSG